jgi:subfamily B ATP-binding cassette protein MsbA
VQVVHASDALVASNKADFRALIAMAAPYRLALALSVLLMLCQSAAALAVPWLGGKLTEALLPAVGDNLAAIHAVLIGMFAVFGVQALLTFADVYLLGAMTERIVADLKITLYDHLQALPLSFFHRRRQGDTLALLTNDVHTVSGFISGTALSVVPLLFTAGGSVLLMFHIRPMLALFAMVLIPVFYLSIKLLGRRLRPLAGQLQEEQATAVVIAEENLGMLPAIKTFTREQQESTRYRQQIDRIVKLSAKQRKIYAALGPSVQFIAAAGIVVVLWLASGELNAGSLTPAQLVSFLLYAQLLTRPVSALAGVWGQTQHARAALARLRQAMDEKPEPSAHVGTKLPMLKGEIEFRESVLGIRGGVSRCPTSISGFLPGRRSRSSAPTVPGRARLHTC